VSDETDRADKWARWSMYLGIASPCFNFLTALPAIGLGAMAWDKASSGGRTRALLGIGLSFSVLFLSMIGLLFPPSPEEVARLEMERAKRDAERAEAQAQARADSEAAELAKWEALPKTERAFCDALKTYKAQYAAGGNDLKKSAARRDRAKAVVAGVPGGKVSQWQGTIQNLTTTGDGNVVLVVALPCGPFTVGTWNNELSDIMDRTLISRESSAFNVLAELQEGSTITFSGTLLRDETDGFRTSSLTESGSMNGGQFLIRFR